jgi:hypothetical protein
VLEALTRQWAGREGAKIELLAHHAVRGERWDQAARYLYQSSQRAFAQARYHASAASHEAAIEALDQLGHTADLTLAQGVYFDVTIPAALPSAIERAHEAFERADPHDLRTRSYAQYIVGCACRDLGRIGGGARVRRGSRAVRGGGPIR